VEKHFPRGNPKSFVGELTDKKFLIEIDFMIIILRVSGKIILVGIPKISHWHICVFQMYENNVKLVTQG
jgi:hypothetical protein